MSRPTYTVTVLRAGGRDARGNPRPDVEHEEWGATIAPRSDAGAENVDRSDVAYSRVWLGFKGRADVDIVSTDQVRIPNGAPMAGLWRVVGEVGDWRGLAAGGMDVLLERGA